jgi:hypothetical protein
MSISGWVRRKLGIDSRIEPFDVSAILEGAKTDLEESIAKLHTARQGAAQSDRALLSATDHLKRVTAAVLDKADHQR